MPYGPFDKGEFTVSDATANVMAVPYGIARAITFQSEGAFNAYGSPATGKAFTGPTEDVPGALPRAVVGKGTVLRPGGDVTIGDAMYSPHQTASLGNNTASQAWYFVCAAGETSVIRWQRH